MLYAREIKEIIPAFVIQYKILGVLEQNVKY
jgi:hypothetical protein